MPAQLVVDQATTNRICIQRRVPPAGVPGPALMRKWVKAALAGHEVGEVTVRIVDEAESAQLNGRFRHKDVPTNVLSFNYDAEALDAPVLGDLVICAPVVEREAGEQGKDSRAHWAHMVVHGILHLLGHDHENESDAAVMEAQERVVLSGLGFPDPY